MIFAKIRGALVSNSVSSTSIHLTPEELDSWKRMVEGSGRAVDSAHLDGIAADIENKGSGKVIVDESIIVYLADPEEIAASLRASPIRWYLTE